MDFQTTDLWRQAFEPREDDQHEEARSLLRTALLSMRDQVKELVTHIPADCKNLTVHDISHVDALWTSADLLCGSEWELNPSETFVLGAAILTHDAGLTSIAYPEGRAGLKKLDLWDDLVADELQKTGGSEITAEQEASVLFAVLRELHAERAGSLCTQAWVLKPGNNVYLLENSELREAFGECIGRIAHSHHWSINRVAEELSSQIGGSPSLPAGWDINEQKLACILRCADAAQVDRTRAPLLLQAAVNPTGFSKAHWLAQSKLNRPTVCGDSIQFTSSSVFSSKDSEAWWVAYDLAQILDKEINSSNALLTEIGQPPFVVQRVAGAKSSRSFANLVKTTDWHPIDASIRVTDPVSLAKKLGGENLYGRNILVPFRELIQNAADAIRARRAHEQRGQEFGRINVTIEAHPSDDTLCLVHVDDDGLGMSSRVLTTTLVDFGKTFWDSSALREEFPGLRSSGFQRIGKFGIGFFSIFDFTDKVSVTSRRYDLGKREANALEFSGLAARPLLRTNASDRLPNDTSTRVTMSLKKAELIEAEAPPKKDKRTARGLLRKLEAERRAENTKSLGFTQRLLSMVSFLDVEVQFKDLRTGEQFRHLPDIYGSASTKFLDELYFTGFTEQFERHKPQSMLSSITDASGTVHGRAALDVEELTRGNSGNSGSFGCAAVGGIVTGQLGIPMTTSTGAPIPFIGVVECSTVRASREYAHPNAPEKAIDRWLEGQLNMVDLGLMTRHEQLLLGSAVYSTLGKKLEIPLVLHRGVERSARFLEELVKRSDRVIVPASFSITSQFGILGYNQLSPEYFEVETVEELVVFGPKVDYVVPREVSRKLHKSNGGSIAIPEMRSQSSVLFPLIDMMKNKMGRDPELTVAQEALFDTRIPSLSKPDWCLVIS
ncbi:heat shock protein 90 [Pelagimonas phthalicica]|uniref:Heat shock protein 90 n=1 Tax=Pelagimonas phthalicica TaxID=1037362 RepID=A0A238JAB9_9RHOB|nr:ATP-binding protein [Pelagimonas phthalicica]TDS94162.1 histidine kinase/DNA gyrase B/HSP90-like ATPase [Pelagimonas phthalicica]SMX27313.1 heat shock protein 90 [Pelagimonas phthalicica]